ncbi:MAG: pyridoxal phosphate-dependent aminotransferase [Bdellovibrionales bacterium]
MQQEYKAPPYQPHTQPHTQYRARIETLPENKAAELLAYGKSKPDVISLAQGEGSNTTPDFIIDAAMSAARNGKTFYAPTLGYPELRSALSSYYPSTYDCPVPSERIFVTGSGTNAVHLALNAILEEGDEVVAVTPIWKNLLGAVAVAQGRIKEVPLTHENQKWELDMNALFDAVTEKTKAIMVVTPSNPTGWVMSDEEIKALVHFAREKNIWIIADEVYGRITYHEKKHAPTFLHHIHDEDKVFVVNSFSKAWSMTGWRLGWLVGPKSSEKIIHDLALYNNMGPASFSQYGGLVALQEGEEYLSKNLALWQRNKDQFYDIFSRYNHIEYSNPDATFYGFFKVKTEPSCLDFSRRLIDEFGISLAPGISFGKDFQGWIRICYALSENIMDEAFLRLEKGITGS